MKKKRTLILLCCLFLLGDESFPLDTDGQPLPAKTEKVKLKIDDLGSAPLRYPGVRWTLYYGSYEGVEEFNKKLAAIFTQDLQPGELRAHFDGMPEFNLTDAPAIENRGIWTWGYDPETSASDLESALKGNGADATLEYSQKLAAIRPGAEFAMCAKGWIQLRWMTETEPHGSYILGERTHEYIHNRLQERQPRWDYVNAKWAANFPVAQRFYREMRAASKAPMTVVGLIEDGMFEEQIQPSVSLLGEMLWNPNREPSAVLEALVNAANNPAGIGIRLRFQLKFDKRRFTRRDSRVSLRESSALRERKATVHARSWIKQR